jgi:hypothetical protein
MPPEKEVIMSESIDWKRIGELAGEFSNAAERKISQNGPLDCSPEELKYDLGQRTTEGNVNRQMQIERWIKFIRHITRDEMSTILQVSFEGVEVSNINNEGKDLVEYQINNAEIFAKAGQRAGMSEDFRALVPEELKNKEIRKALSEKAPAFANLCM